MARGKKDRSPGSDPPHQSGGAGSGKGDFRLHEHIGRTLKALFDEVTAQPVPEKLRELLRELERKKQQD
jgi:hypothetical protein